MEARYRIPKRKVTAEIRTDVGTLRVQLFLSEIVERHSGADPAEFAGLLKARGITLAVGTPAA